MNKEYLDAFGRISSHTEYDNDGSYDSLNFEDDCKLVDEALERLEQIDNAEPSEALKSFDYIVRNLEAIDDSVYMDCIEHLTTIKQALQRLEANDKVNNKVNDKVKKTYLKWEDLKFTEENQTMEVLLNGVTYSICFYEFTVVGQNEVNIYTNGTHIVTLNSYYPEDIKFFNNLHLEMVE